MMEQNKKELPVLYKEREMCCGCSACHAICPVGAIEMKADIEGFFYPIVDVEKCIKCYRCLSVCIFKKDQLEKGYILDGEKNKS